MDIQLLSFVLALVLGLICFGLVKHTADEFDRWYEEPVVRRAPALMGVVVTIATAALFVFLR